MQQNLGSLLQLLTLKEINKRYSLISSMSRNPFYVYALKDPRTKPLKPFYIGKGTGNRIRGHILQIDESIKSNLINEIRKAGLEVIHTVIADDLTEEQALKIDTAFHVIFV